MWCNKISKKQIYKIKLVQFFIFANIMVNYCCNSSKIAAFYNNLSFLFCQISFNIHSMFFWNHIDNINNKTLKIIFIISLYAKNYSKWHKLRIKDSNTQNYFVEGFTMYSKYATLILQNILNCCLEGRNYEKTATQLYW